MINQKVANQKGINQKMRKSMKAAKRLAAIVLAAAVLAVMPAGGPAVSEVRADEALPGYVRSVYTNEWIPEIGRASCRERVSA